MKRRGSIIAPVILILIGLLFLANNLRPDIPMLDFLGRYWPFLLIGWGLVRLLEILVWAVQGKPLPTSGVSGGEWVLVFFLTVLGTGLHAFHTNVGWPPNRIRMRGIEVFGESFDYTMDEKKVAVNKAKRMILENIRGNARINGSDSTEIRIVGRTTVRALSRERADESNRLAELELIEQGDSIVVRTNQNRAPEERYITADLEITVPRGISIETRGRDGDIEVNDLQGDVEVDSDRAGVRVKNIGGAVRVNLRRSDIVRATSVQGEVDLKGRGQDVELDDIKGQVTIDGSWGGELQFRNIAKPLRYQGMQAELQIERVTGEARLGRGFLQGDSLQGPIVLHGRNKGCCDVRLSDFTSSLNLEIERGDVDLRPGSPVPKMDVDVRNGEVDLVLPSSAKFNLRARVDKGEVSNEYGDPVRTSDEDRGGTLTANHGDGPAIVIDMERGNVRVRKANSLPVPTSPLTPEPPEPKRAVE
ncbi:MAG TPA: DUF4097 family beta strand repeat-containing protein [Bryobacteraceae bacterium]|nr:DUF4097 family beta strand repeat-containing protein [Bryobacteraceae bacterium]